MPLRPADFRIPRALLAQCRAALVAWDTRDIWSADQRGVETAVRAALDAACAPRLVLLPSPAHEAKFLREMLELSEAS